MRQITVLGGLGYIGCNLVDLLTRNKDYYVKNLDIELFGKNHAKYILERKNFEHIKGDVCNTIDLAKAIKGSECVINLAGLVGDPACSLNQEHTWLYNTESSCLISDICNYYNVERLIYSSSCSVYGAAPSNILLNEGSPLNPLSLYATTKIDSEKIFMDKFKGILTIVRLGTVFGFSKRMRFDLVANLFTIKAIKEGKISVHGGKQYRPFIHCKDASKAFFTICNTKENSLIDKEIFNVVCENTTILDLAKLVSKCIKGSEIAFTDKKEDNRNYVVDSSKIEWVLGFKPSIKLKDGIEDISNNITMEKYNDWNSNDLYHNHRICGIKL